MAIVTKVRRSEILVVVEMFGVLLSVYLQISPMVLLFADGWELTVKGDALEPLVFFVFFLEADLTGLLGSCSLDTFFW